MKLVAVLLGCWLALAQSATVGPEDGAEGRPPPPSDDILQVEISPEQMPPFPFPNGDLEQQEVDLPVLVHGEPQGFTPRGRRPSCSGPSCSHQPPRFKLDEFPPGRPTRSNLGNICAEGRKTVSYGPWNLPQTGFGHLSRQGEALNRMEVGLGGCCRLPARERLSCSTGVWSDVLQQFCHEEFSVKAAHYHCCKLEGAKRDRCFAKEAPFPNYCYQDAASPGLQERPATCASSRPALCKAADLAGPRRIPEISFPPGQPSSANIKNICALRKFRPSYPAGSLPQSGFSWLARQAQALNRVENEFKKCCRRQDVSCARKGWEKGLSLFCRQEFMAKTKPHHCCKEEQGEPRSSCFAREAPYPSYDKEAQAVSLAEVTPALLDLLCGQFVLLTKQRQIPTLVQNITELCCKAQGDERTLCAAEAKTQFIATLCSSPRGSWKDPKRCCAQAEGEARDGCFGRNYLSNVSLASAVEVPQPTEPSV